MEQPPGSIDDLQPQDLSTSSIASVIDLARKGEECVLSSTSLDALRIVKSPSWYTNSVTSSNNLHFPDSGSSDIILQSSDQIQPDNAFSNTTVTLSYVSRSCVFSNQDSLPQRAPICGVPSIAKLSLHPLCHSDEGTGDTGYSLSQHYLEQVDSPVNLTSQTELFQSSSHDQLGPESDGAVGLTWNSHEINGGVISRNGDVDKNGSWSSSAVCAESSPETITPATIEEEEREGSDVIFLVSKKQVNPDSRGARGWCSLNREYISPLEDPVSPSITSQDDAEDVFALPQASSSPSGDNSYLETSDDVACNDLNTEGPTQPGSGTSNCTMMLDSTNEMEQPVQRRSTAFEPLVDLTDDVCLSEVLESEPKTVSPHMNRNAKTLERNLKENKLPMRSGRGMRLEAVVMNINSSRYNLSGCIRTNKKTNASQSTARNCKRSNTKRNDTKLGKRKAKASISVKTMKQKTVVQQKMGKTNNINNTDSCKDFTSDSDINHFKKSHGTTPPNTPPLSSHKNSKKEPEQLSQPDISVEVHAANVAPTATSTSPKKSPGKASVNARGSKTSPTAKRKQARSLNSRRKQHKNSQPFSMFSPDEPEIKLRYVNHKEEKRDSRLGSFSPFIHVELQHSSPSLCTVVNYPEETKTQHKKGQPAQSGGFVCAVVPSTSCLQLGRVSTQSQHQRSLICCLCRLSANAIDLGDLHGPYYPEGYQPSTKTPASVLGPKAEPDGYSDSDSSSCSVNDRGRKRVAAHTPRPLRLGAQLKQKGLPEPESQWRASDNTRSPTAKRARSDVGSADGKDWYSPPVLPLEPCEYWLHEDCGIWSAGVFLVKGKVYGLEEVVKVAQETMCSACSDPGATLGCFFKNCPNKYHYRCALESGCVLIEENFSMKCKKHKNKTFKASSGNRWEDR